MLLLPVTQVLMVAGAGPEEGGRFFGHVAVVMLLAAVADLGATRVFPVLVRSRKEGRDADLSGILGWRWLLSLVAAGGLLVLPSVRGHFGWSPETLFRVSGLGGGHGGNSLAMALLLLGRVQAWTGQGFLHAYGEYGRLAAGMGLNWTVTLGGLSLAWFAGPLNASVGLWSLVLGTWATALFLHQPGIGPGNPLRLAGLPFRPEGRRTWRRIFPYAFAAGCGAVNARAPALIGRALLPPALFGGYALIDSGYRMLLAPGFLAAQSFFPHLRAALIEGGRSGMERAARSFLWSAVGVTMLTTVVGLLGWLVVTGRSPETHWMALAYALSLPLIIPNSLLGMVWLCLGWEREWAWVTLWAMLLRVGAARLACGQWAANGLAWSHLLLETVIGCGLWVLYARRRKTG